MHVSLRIMKTLVIITLVLFSLGPLSLVGRSETLESSQIVDVENKFCPVSGDKVSGKHFVEYKGKRYSLCCKMCANKFKKDPDKYLAKLAEIESGKVPADSGHHEHMH